MKKSIFSMLFFLFAVTAFSQGQNIPKHSRDFYLKTSKNQKNLANVFAITGGAFILASFVIPKGEATVVPASSGPIFPSPGYTTYKNDDTKNIFLAISSAFLISSIPLYLSSFIMKGKAGRATTINFNNQRILFPQQGSFVFKTQPSFTLKIVL